MVEPQVKEGALEAQGAPAVTPRPGESVGPAARRDWEGHRAGEEGRARAHGSGHREDCIPEMQDRRQKEALSNRELIPQTFPEHPVRRDITTYGDCGRTGRT